MWISGGEHEITENIVHLVLAKIPGPDGKPLPGTKGISLFIVPKHLVDTQGRLTGERNDVALAGLNHKLGYRGTTNCLLNFGEGRQTPGGKRGAIGYLVSKPGDGLRCMFHMMNEARIGVGLGAVMLGYAGYEASLEYARQRPQGRAITAAGKDAASPQRPIIEHADVKRMLLAQKSFVEGGLALELFCARLVDEQQTGSAEDADAAKLLLEVLTPIAKSWPSEWCLEANSLAIQVLGGYGYTRDFPVEQYWRENPAQHDPRGHARHPGPGPAGSQGRHGRRQGADGAGRARERHRPARRPGARSCRGGQRAGAALAAVGGATKKAWSTGQPEGGAGQCDAVSAGLRPHGAGLDLAGRGAVR
ncbi:3-methylmercaptopropionyl-CoA dehydrogenase [Ditylenchus destructor]|nr:3-methylmercaptopropionyl-CoA dehydrogenase [Ditylenchus destructor]